MWVFTSSSNSGKVQKSKRPFLIIRARLASDLARLRKEYMPQLSETTVLKEGHYPFYATIGHKDFEWGLGRMRLDIQFSFKSEARKSGTPKEKRCSQNAGTRRENLKSNEEVRVALHRLFKGKTVVCPYRSYEGKVAHMAFFEVEEVVSEGGASGQKCKDSGKG